MRFKIFYNPNPQKTLCAVIPADNVKQALTRFTAAGFEGVIRCIQDAAFDSNLFNF